MKNTTLLFAFSILCFFNQKATAQDAFFTEWETMSMYFNPALTGDFDGEIRFRIKYRDQGRSVLKDNSYKTRGASLEYKLPVGNKRKFNVGFHSVHDKAGTLSFRNGSYNLSTAVIQNLGDPESAHHSIAVGITAGIGTKKINWEDAIWPGGPSEPEEGLKTKISFADFSAGLNWKYVSNSHFSAQVGSAFHHVNKPNVSFFEEGNQDLYVRINLHGNVEIPLAHNSSIIPSFLYTSQGPSEHLLFGMANKWYLKSSDSNFAQLGIYARTAEGFDGWDIVTYSISGLVEINSILFGLSYDRFQLASWNAFEFSVGYTFGNGFLGSKSDQ